MSGFSYQQTGTFLLEDENWAGLASLNCYVPPVNNSSEEVEMKKKSPAESSTLVNKRRKNAASAASKKPKKDAEAEAEAVDKKSKKVLEEPPKGYIHVRARRGQATDSHSLAERVRREKISERMKTLQSLVPGCDKVSGKALVLDEIINYVQSLQNQVEFLSMKLASMNPLFYEFGMGIDDLQCLTAMEAVSPFVIMQGQRPADFAGSMLSETDRQCLKTLTPPLFDNGFVFSPMK